MCYQESRVNRALYHTSYVAIGKEMQTHLKNYIPLCYVEWSTYLSFNGGLTNSDYLRYVYVYVTNLSVTFFLSFSLNVSKFVLYISTCRLWII